EGCGVSGAGGVGQIERAGRASGQEPVAGEGPREARAGGPEALGARDRERQARREHRQEPPLALVERQGRRPRRAPEHPPAVEQWVELTRKKGPRTHRECTSWLREKHGHGSRNSWWIASVATAAHGEPDYGDPESLVDALYSGAKAAWRPLHEKVIDAALACG